MVSGLAGTASSLLRSAGGFSRLAARIAKRRFEPRRVSARADVRALFMSTSRRRQIEDSAAATFDTVLETHRRNRVGRGVTPAAPAQKTPRHSRAGASVE
jgi:hypothetical protein